MIGRVWVSFLSFGSGVRWFKLGKNDQRGGPIGPGYPEEAAVGAAFEDEDEEAAAAAVPAALLLAVEVESDRALAGLEPITPFGFTPLLLLKLVP